MSMDYLLSESVKTTNMENIPRLALIYDVVCEYGIYLLSCFDDHPGLTMPESLEVIQAIGLFHVHGHKSDCLHRYATTYIPGLAVIDGEIVETLWAVLNKTARSTRGATIAHRTEVLDDHMGDSNWKKIINMGIFHPSHLLCCSNILKASTIVKKYQRATREQAEVSIYFESLTESCPQDLVPIWTREIEAAEAERQFNVTSMDYMNPKVEKRNFLQ